MECGKLKSVYAIMLSLVFLGCSYHWQSNDPISPVSYNETPFRSADSVGKLRRLALMPLELKSYKGKYHSPKAQAAATSNIQDIFAEFLTEVKGYEVITIRDNNAEWEIHDQTHLKDEDIQYAYQKWSGEKTGTHSAAIIKEIGLALNADGVMVVRINESKPWGAVEGLMNIALMNLPLIYEMVTPDIGVWIYETSSGRLVWREKTAVIGEDPNPDATHDLILLFRDLENAVSRQLIK